MPITHPLAATARPNATPDGIAGLLSERVVDRSPLVALTALLRPLLVAALFRDEMRWRPGGRAPADVWETTDETPLTAFAG